MHIIHALAETTSEAYSRPHNKMKLENLAQTCISQTGFNTIVVRKRL